MSVKVHDLIVKYSVSSVGCSDLINKHTIYVGSDDGYLYAIKSSSLGLAKSPWPKFHHDNKNTGQYTDSSGTPPW